MKILFLDIDGVVNCSDTKQRFEGCLGIDPEKANLIKKILEETGAKVVLSSVWRLKDTSREHVKEKVCDFIDITPDFGECGFRGEEIDSWLNKNKQVTKYAIVDDNNWMLPGQKFFKTNFQTGLTEEITKEIIEYLK